MILGFASQTLFCKCSYKCYEFIILTYWLVFWVFVILFAMPNFLMVLCPIIDIEECGLAGADSIQAGGFPALWWVKPLTFAFTYFC